MATLRPMVSPSQRPGARSRGAEPDRVWAPDWYARMLGPPLVSVDRALDERLGAAGRRGPLRGAGIAWLARRGERVALVKGTAGVVTLACIDALSGRRRLVLLELIDRQPPERRARRILHAAWSRLIERPALRRATWRAHVLTTAELERHRRRYGLSAERLFHVPWALVRDSAERPGPLAGAGRVLASGRARCDWETLFAAAADSGWDLRVVCGRHDLARVERLARGSGAEVHCELSRERHETLLRDSDVFVMPLLPSDHSAGHVRLLAATSVGVPVVVTRIGPLEGYVVPGQTAVTVPPREPGALRREVDRLLAGPERGEDLRDAAIARGRRWSYPDFFAAMRELIGGGTPRIPEELGLGVDSDRTGPSQPRARN